MTEMLRVLSYLCIQEVPLYLVQRWPIMVVTVYLVFTAIRVPVSKVKQGVYYLLMIKEIL
jgi:hypothetical protein